MSRLRRRARARRGMTDLTLTPLIDTALTLLVIFMIATPMLRNSITVQLPKGQAQEVKGEPARVVVQVNGKGEFFIDGTRIADKKNLIDAIKREAQRTNAAMVVVEADEHVQYGAVYELIDQIKVVGGIEYVAMSSRRA